MLLPAHFERARQAVRRGGERGVGVAARHELRRLRSRSRRPRASAIVTSGGRGSVVDLRQPRGARGRRGCWSRRRGTGAGRDRGSRPSAKQPVVVEDRADIVLAGDVGGGEDRDDARGGADRVEVERRQPRHGRRRRGRRRGGACRAARADRRHRPRAPATWRSALSCGSGWWTARPQPWSTLTGSLLLRPRCGAADWRRPCGDRRRIRAGRRAAVIARRAPARRPRRVLGPGPAGQRGLAAGRAGGNAGHAAEGDARLGDDAVLDAQREGAADAGDVAVEPLGELDDADQHVGRRARECGRSRRTRRARGPACRSPGRNPRARWCGARRPRRSVSSAPSAINAGGMSPIGEPLAILPPIVPALRTWTPPIRRTSSPRSGCRRASASRASE